MYSTLFNEIMKEYEKRQKMAFDALEERKKEAFTRCPQLEDIEDRIKKAGLEYNKKILLSSNLTQEEENRLAAHLEQEIHELQQLRRAMLISAGFDEDYLEPRYQCNRCKDTGYIPTSSGSVQCSCLRQSIINACYGASNLHALDTQNFDCFREDYFSDERNEELYGIKLSPRENILAIRDKCLSFVKNFDGPETHNLFFFGPAGVGKTFMSCCIARELLDQGRTVLYQTAPALFDIMNEHKVRKLGEEEYDDTTYRNILECELLIIDDLGAENMSESKYSELFQVLNSRILNNSLRPCKTIISTNMNPSQFQEEYTGRLFSRIIGHFDLIKFIGEDIRIKKKLEKIN